MTIAKRFLTTASLVLAITAAPLSAAFDISKDLLIAQFDGLPDADDIHSQAAYGCIINHPSFLNVKSYGVHNAYGRQRAGSSISAIFNSRELMALVFGGAEGTSTWTDANTTDLAQRTNPTSKWAISVQRIANTAQATLNAGGAVWVMEAGQSDITADWVKVLITRGVSAALIKQKVSVIQHSTWNEDQASSGVLDYVKSMTSYQKIGDGNSAGNGTPDYHTDNSTSVINAHKVLRNNAKSTTGNPNSYTRSLWTVADSIIGSWDASYSQIGEGGLDFSDSVEAWHILGIQGNLTIPEFWQNYVMIPTPPVNDGLFVQAESFTSMSGITTEVTTDVGGGQNLGWIDNGDWSEYSVNIPSAGIYQIETRVASAGAGGAIEIVTGGNVLGSVSVSNAGGWQTWATVKTRVTFASAGLQTLRLNYVGATGALFNLNWFKISAADVTAPAVPTGLVATGGNAAVSLNWNDNTDSDFSKYGVFRSTSATSPFSLVAEVTASAYTDSSVVNGVPYSYAVTAIDTSGNESTTTNQISATPKVPTQSPVFVQAENFSTKLNLQTQTTTDAGGGQNISHIVNGSHTDYSVTIPTAGTYTVSFRVASANSGGTINMLVGGSTIGSRAVVNTGGWQTWTTVTTTATFAAGPQTLRLQFAGTGGYLMNVNWFELKK